ncbi:MAG: hypothetical protein ACYDCK_13170 [Thermoplasmatota archaeon]
MPTRAEDSPKPLKFRLPNDLIIALHSRKVRDGTKLADLVTAALDRYFTETDRPTRAPLSSPHAPRALLLTRDERCVSAVAGVLHQLAVGAELVSVENELEAEARIARVAFDLVITDDAASAARLFPRVHAHTLLLSNAGAVLPLPPADAVLPRPWDPDAAVATFRRAHAPSPPR